MFSLEEKLTPLLAPTPASYVEYMTTMHSLDIISYNNCASGTLTAKAVLAVSLFEISVHVLEGVEVRHKA